MDSTILKPVNCKCGSPARIRYKSLLHGLSAKRSAVCRQDIIAIGMSSEIPKQKIKP